MTRNQFAGNRTWVRIPPSPPELAVTSHCQLFLYCLLCTIFGTASEHTIHCICRNLLRVVIQVSVGVCCSRIGTVSQPNLDLFHCDIFTAVKQMPCPLSVQFFHSGSHTVILAAPAEKAVRRVRAILAAGELPAHWLLFRLWSIARGKVSVKQPFPRTTPLQRWLVDHPDITIQIPRNHTEHLLLLIFCFENKKEGVVSCSMTDTAPHR